MKARLPQGFGGGMPSNMNQMMKQAQKLKKTWQESSRRLSKKNLQ